MRKYGLMVLIVLVLTLCSFCNNKEADKAKGDLLKSQVELQKTQADLQKSQVEFQKTQTDLQKIQDRYKDIELIAKEIKDYRIKHNVRPTDSMQPTLRHGNLGGWVIDDNRANIPNEITEAFKCLETIDKLNTYTADDYFKKQLS